MERVTEAAPSLTVTVTERLPGVAYVQVVCGVEEGHPDHAYVRSFPSGSLADTLRTAD